MAADGDGGVRKPGGEHVYDLLVEAGVELLVGLPGTQTLPLDRIVVQRDDIDYLMARHETAIPHIAWGYYEASGEPAATLTVPGPGDTNAMHGLKNAAEDCVPILHVSADADPDERGKGPIHEIEPDTFDNVVKRNVNVERRRRLREQVSAGIETALSPPTGPVRLGVPSGFLADEVAAPDATVSPETVEFDHEPACTRAAAVLDRAQSPVVLVGGGARRSEGGPAAVRELSATLNAPVLGTYKGKGVVPDDDQRVMGVASSHVPPGARAVLEAADVVVAVGSDLDGLATDHWSLPLGETLIHVNLDAGEFDRAYDADVAVAADVADACQAITAALDGAPGWDGGSVAEQVRAEYESRLEDAGFLADTSPAPTVATLRAVREAAPEKAIVATDVGGFRLWAFQTFRAAGPRRYISAGSWAGMGNGLPAAIGAKEARPDRPVVCLTGDGGLMMCIHELHTAAERDLDLTVVVFDNADYGVISKSPKIQEYAAGHRFSWRSPDYVKIAEGFGCRATRVETPSGAREAVAEALDRDGPSLVSVDVDPDEPSAPNFASHETDLEF